MKFDTYTDEKLKAMIKEMSIEELNNLEYKIREEKDLREFKKKEEAWEKVVNAMNDFIKDYGRITIEDYGKEAKIIDECYTFNEIGVFREAYF